MAENRNYYFDLMDDADSASSTAPSQPKNNSEVIGNADVSVNPYLALMDDGKSQSLPISTPSVLSGGLGASNKISGSIGEFLANAPKGSVGEINELMRPSKSKMTPQVAARLAMEAKNPSGMDARSSGSKWKANWANIDDPTFEGGVPEAAQSYNRGKPSGKVSGKLYKKFGNQSLSIKNVNASDLAAGVDEVAAATENERVAKSMVGAKKIAGPLSVALKGVGAAGVGLGAYDTYERSRNQDTHGSIASGLGTVASAVAPFMASAGILPAVGAAAPLYLMAHDRLKNLEQNPQDYRLQEDEYDAMGNRQR